MKTYTLFILYIIFCGCNFTYENNTNNDAALAQLKRETDLLKNEINALKYQSIRKDTLDGGNERVVLEKIIPINDSVLIKHVPSVVKPVEKKVIPKQTQSVKKPDSTFYFYTKTKKISAKIPPRNVRGDKIKIQFFDPKGNITFEQEDIYASYSISTDIKEFHPNGAVKRIVIHFNPGASMHWYETIITFDTNNTPSWKEEITYPMTMDNMMNNKSYWDATKKQWIKQEVVQEQPYVK